MRIIILLLLLITANYCYAELKYEEVPAAELFSGVPVSNFKFSPDSTKLMFYYWTPEGTIVVVFDSETLSLLHKFKKPKQVEAINWLSDTELVFERFGMLFRSELDISDPKVMLDWSSDGAKSIRSSRLRYWSFRGIHPTEKTTIFVESNNKTASIYKYNYVTGDRVELLDGQRLNITNWITDSNGVTKVGTRTKKKVHEYFWVNEGKIAPIVLPNGDDFKETTGETHKQRYFMETVLPNSRNIIFSENEKSDYLRLIEVDPLDGTIVKEVGRLENKSLGYMEDYFVTKVDVEQQILGGYRYFDKQYQSVWLTRNFQNIQRELDALYPDITNNIITKCSRNMKYCVAEKIDASGDSDFYLYNGGTKKASAIYSRPENLASYVMHPAEELNVSGASENNINVLYYRPPQSKDLGKEIEALVVMPCDGPFYRGVNLYSPERQFFATRNFAVAYVNGRGCTGQGRSNMLGEKGQLLNNMATDVNSVTAELATRDELKGKKIFLYSSDNYGGLVALHAAKILPERYGAVATFGVPIDLRAYYKYIKKVESGIELSFWALHATDKKPLKTYLKEASLMSLMKSASFPILYAYGTDDTSPIKKVASSLEKKKYKKLKLLPLPDTHRSIRRNRMKEYYAESALSYFRRVL